MNIEQIDWEDLRLLLAASRAGSLSGLASDMGIDATTASRRLKALERAVDVSLFVRTRGGLALTEQALHLVRYAQQMEQSEHGFRLAAQNMQSMPEGRVRISAPPTLARTVLAPGIAALQEQIPGLSIDLETESANIRLERLEADIAVRLGAPEDAHDDLVARKIGRAAYAVFSPIEAPASERWIAYPQRFAHVPEAKWVERRLNGAAPVLRSNDPVAMAQAVAAGAGSAVLPELMNGIVPGMKQQGSPILYREIWLLRHAEVGSTSIVRSACEWVIDRVRAATG